MLEMHIEVSDVERSLEIYSKLLPHEEVSWFEERDAVALVFKDGSAFGIWEKGKIGIHGGRAGAHLHFAFKIESREYDSYKNKIKEVGLSPLEHEWPGGVRSVYFIDDDGNQGEFMTSDWLANS